MAVYLVLNILFMALVLLVLRIRPRIPSVSWWIMMAIILTLTAVFDSIIVASSIVGYSEGKILGIYIGRAPIEDFCYAVLAAIIVPYFWIRFNGNKND